MLQAACPRTWPDSAGGWRQVRGAHQAEQEIGAQFQAFANTGLALDHVNAHQHYHMHPFCWTGS